MYVLFNYDRIKLVIYSAAFLIEFPQHIVNLNHHVAKNRVLVKSWSHSSYSNSYTLKSVVEIFSNW